MILNKLNMQTQSSKKEGSVARAIESETSKVPSDYYLWFGLGAMGLSLLLQTTKFRHTGLAIGQAAAPILLMGLYNKIVKTHGHDQEDLVMKPKKYLPDLG